MLVASGTYTTDATYTVLANYLVPAAEHYIHKVIAQETRNFLLLEVHLPSYLVCTTPSFEGAFQVMTRRSIPKHFSSYFGIKAGESFNYQALAFLPVESQFLKVTGELIFDARE